MRLKEILMLESGALPPDFQDMYRKLSKKYHPDLNKGDGKKMQVLNDAKDNQDYRTILKLYMQEFPNDKKEYSKEQLDKLSGNQENIQTNIDIKTVRSWTEEFFKNRPEFATVGESQEDKSFVIMISSIKGMVYIQHAERFKTKEELFKVLSEKVR